MSNISPNWSSKEMLFPGMWVYRDVIKPEIDIMNRVSNLLENNKSGLLWEEATVGYMEKKPSYRDCKDFKIGEIKNPMTDDEATLGTIWQDAYNAQIPAVEDYCGAYNIRMNYWEVMNFIQYGPGQHFQEHADHGFSYSATVSLVAYPNDEYDGGELVFPKLNLSIKPKAGDLYIFPSTYLFSHLAAPVTSGRKYSIVTMLDYNDHAHNPDFMRMRAERVEREKHKGIQN
jgi:hypothetical protein